MNFIGSIRLTVIAKKMAWYRLSFALLVICFCMSANAQIDLEEKIDFTISNSLLSDGLWELSEATDVSFAYRDSDLPQTRVSYSFIDKSLKHIIEKILSAAELDYSYSDQGVVIFKPILQRISGYVEDASSGERLIGASVYSVGSNEGAVTNIYGFYTIQVETSSPYLKVSYLGYESQNVNAMIGNSELIIQLEPNLTIQEVVVTERSNFDNNSYGGFLSDQNFAKDISKLPAFGGELDYMRLLQQLPGVQSGTDGLGGLYVRGGNADQNLVLLDGVPIYNPYHALGLVSIFDEQVIKKVTYHRGQFPSRYGGMISSVVDVRTKEGNNKEYKMNAGVGLVASKMKLEGPIAKGKGSFLVSARRTHIDPLLRKYSREKRAEDNQEGFYDYSFGEVMAKINYGFSSKTKVFLSLYKGNDTYENELKVSEVDNGFSFKEEESQDLSWGNTIGSVRLNYQMSDKMFSNFTSTYSKFFFQSNENRYFEVKNDFEFDQQSRYKESYFSNITNVGLKADFDYVPNSSHYLRAGVEYSHSIFQPGVLSTQDSLLYFGFEELTEELQKGKGEVVSELNIYVEDEWLIHQNFGVNIGLYSSLFIVDEKNYLLFDPRLSINWQASRPLSFHFSVNRLNQPLHLLTRTGSGFPNDLWVPSTGNVAPQQAWVVDLESRFRLGKEWKAEAHAYYKKMNNLINYIEGADFSSSGNTISAFNWEEKITVGQGKSKGVEFLLKKDKGTCQGWVSYTLSETTRQFDELNGGKIFPFRFDLRHVLSIVGTVDVSDKWSLSGNWNYSSGSNISLAYSDWEYIRQDGTPDFFFFDLEDRNSFKLPSYHRLDIAAKYNKPTNWGKWSVNFGLYNVYNRRNIFFVSPKYDPITNTQKYKSTSLISILPYFSFNIEI